jgi:hypothetical protein
MNMCRSISCFRSPSYQVLRKKSSQQQQEAGRKGKKHQIQQQKHGSHSTSPPQQPHSGVILEASTVFATVQQQLRGNNGGGGVQVENVATPSAVAFERKPTKDGLTKVRNIATSSISGEAKASLLNNKHRLVLKYGLLSFIYIMGVKHNEYDTHLITWRKRFVH